ncbi:uncharacterized protein LOC129947936 [Eupeodes corollae]|uniref:uncharacterized protein LOC129947936 n=1 Tax=Eupeodes corollae TaxID=290404 RepID=UPI002490F476|nr:uncharacterized protein LOC129947936 [Eupeodes corollae]
MEENNTKPTICLACLQCSVDCIEMISTRIGNSNHEISPTYLDCYKACTQLDIEHGQTINICLSCSNYLLDVYKFIIKARNSYGIIMGIKMNDLVKIDDDSAAVADSQTMTTTKEIQIKQEFMVPERYHETSVHNPVQEETGNGCEFEEPNYYWTQDVIPKDGINSQQYMAKGDNDEVFVIQEIDDFHHTDESFDCNSFSKSYNKTNFNEEHTKKNYHENLVKSQKSYWKNPHVTQSMSSLSNTPQNKAFNNEKMNNEIAEHQKRKLNAQSKKAAYMRQYRARKKNEALFLKEHTTFANNKFNFSSLTEMEMRTTKTTVPTTKIQRHQQQLLSTTKPFKNIRPRLNTTKTKATTTLNESFVKEKYFEIEPLPLLTYLSSSSESSDPQTTTSSMNFYTKQQKRVLSDAERSKLFRERKMIEEASNGYCVEREQMSPLSGADRIRNYRIRKKIAEAAGTIKKTDAERSKRYRARKKFGEVVSTTVKKGIPLSDAERSRNYRARKKYDSDKTIEHESPNLSLPNKNSYQRQHSIQQSTNFESSNIQVKTPNNFKTSQELFKLLV